MDKSEIIAEIKKMEFKEGCVLININKDIIRLLIPEENESILVKPGEVLYNGVPRLWKKNEIGDIVKAFSIKEVILPNGEQVSSSIIEIPRQKKFEEIIKSVNSPYGKKLLFLFKRTRGKPFLQILSKQKYIILAKIEDTHIEFFYGNLNGYENVIPIFTDSEEMNAFLKVNKSMSLEEYKPLLIKFKDILKDCKDNQLLINPESFSIAEKNFSMYVGRNTIEYIKNNF